MEKNLKNKSYELYIDQRFFFFFLPIFYMLPNTGKHEKLSSHKVFHQNINFLSPNIAPTLDLIVQLRYEGKENLKFEQYINTM